MQLCHLTIDYAIADAIIWLRDLVKNIVKGDRKSKESPD